MYLLIRFINLIYKFLIEKYVVKMLILKYYEIFNNLKLI